MDNTKRPYSAIKPGEILKDELDARGWTQGDFAEITGKPIQAINEILSGKKSITPETALLFSEALGTTAEFWLNLETAYRLDILHQERRRPDNVARKARVYSLAPVKELTKRHWIGKASNTEELVKEVCAYYGVDDLEERPKVAVNFRKSDTGLIDAPSMLAWLRKAEIEAKKLACGKFDPQKLKAAIDELPRLSSDARAASGVQNRLCELGTRLVIVPHLPQTRVDGAAFWLDKGSPVVALSLRLDRIDNFWFTLMHELVHIIDGLRSAMSYLDQDIVNDPASEAERMINQRARDLLIPKQQFETFVKKTRPYFSRNNVVAFARDLNIHPSIVVGRLQHEKLIPYTNLRNLLGKASVIFTGK